MDQNIRYEILLRMKKNNPMPRIELIYHSPFELLIAVLLSAKSKDCVVNKITNQLFSIANTPEQILRLGVENLIYYIYPIGLFNKKSNNIIKICQLLLDQYQGEIPENRNALEAMPGVGRKTANIVLNTIFGWPTIAVDTHIFRFVQRTKFTTGHNVLEVEKNLLSVIPYEFKKDCHQWFIQHSRYICCFRKPSCMSCFIQDLCEFPKKMD